MIAHDEIGFPFAHDSDGSAALYALGRAGRMFLAGRVMIGVAHHVHDFAGDGFFSRRISFSLPGSSAAKANGDTTSAAEKLTATVNFNSFEVLSGEYNMSQSASDLGLGQL